MSKGGKGFSEVTQIQPQSPQLGVTSQMHQSHSLCVSYWSVSFTLAREDRWPAEAAPPAPRGTARDRPHSTKRLNL